MSLNLSPVLETLSVVDKAGLIVPFRPYASQNEIISTVERDYAAGEPSRVIILKARQLGTCLDPSTRVLTADLRWVDLEDVLPGQELVSVDEYPPGGKGSGRKLRRTRVDARSEVFEPAFRLVMDNGEVLVATAGHRFLCKVRGAVHTEWRTVQKTRPGDEIRYITQPWGAADYEDGWFSGFLDGEGSLALKSRSGASVCVSQVYGPVYDRAVDYLKSRGYSFRTELDLRKAGDTSKFGNQTVAKLVVSRMNEVFRLLGHTRPARFMGRDWWEGKDLPGKKSGAAWSKVVAIEPLGDRRMIDLQTTTGTFIAEGFVSHNSTCIEAILFSLAILFANTNAVVVSHERESSEYLFSMTKFFYESWPYREFFPHRYSSKYQMSFDEHGSNIWVQTAGKKKAGRSRTIRVAHFSEAAFYSFPHEVMGAFNQSMPYLPGTLQIVESTANGIGNWFHEEWLKAEAGEEGSFTPLFFPWWKHPEYIPCQGKGCHDESCDECVKQARGIKPRDSDEQELTKRYGLSKARLAWRRWALQARTYGNIDLFRAEFPSTPHEAFITSGFNVFSDTWLSRCYKPIKPGVGRLEVRENGRVEFVADPRGPLRMFRQPSTDQNWGSYFIGADPCYSSGMKGDYAAAQVINRNNREQVAVWHGRVNPNDFADELAKLGTFYNLATIAPELEGPGVATVARLTTIYPRIWQYKKVDRWPGLNNTNSLGWSSSWRTKIWAVTKLAQYLERDDVIIHDVQTYRELQNYTYFESGSWGTFGGMGEVHDDLVASLAICLTAESMETPPDAYGEPKTGTDGDDPWE